MALLSKGIHDKEYDVRMIQRGLSKGLILQQEVDQHLKKLPNDEAVSQVVNVEVFQEAIIGKSGLR